MTFVSLSFVAFLFVGIALFYICPVKYRWLVLLGLSVWFYAQSNIAYLPYILLSTLSIYLAGVVMGKFWAEQENKLSAEGLSKDEKKSIKEKGKKKRKAVLIAALVLNLGILCTVKFAKFFIGPVNSLVSFLGGEGEFSAASIIVPLGISYYTFSTVGYLLDVYWKRYPHENNYLRFLLYAIYFPHILQGPIARYNNLGTQLKSELNFDLDRCIKGAQLLLWGYFKKLVIADRLNIFIDGVFENADSNLGLINILAMVADAFYIYADFSGCMDMARGISDIFGIKLELNFERPFLATSVPEFWRRWHITLGAWFRDYVYMPVSTGAKLKELNKKLKKANVSKSLSRIILVTIPVFITWILTGLWHGTGSTYIMWGFYYAFIIALSTAFSEDYQSFLKKHNVKTDTLSWRVLRIMKVFCIFMGGRILTVPGSLSKTKLILESIVHNFNPWVFTNGTFWKFCELDSYGVIVAVLCVALLIGVDLIGEHLGEKSLRDRIGEENLFTGIILTSALTVLILVFGIYGSEYDASAFVYMGY